MISRVHIACNTIPHNEEIARLPEFLEKIDALNADAVIAADLGTIGLVKKYAPHCALHVSVQSGVCNYETARAFYEAGAERVVLARELSLEEIAAILEKFKESEFAFDDLLVRKAVETIRVDSAEKLEITFKDGNRRVVPISEGR